MPESVLFIHTFTHSFWKQMSLKLEKQALEAAWEGLGIGNRRSDRNNGVEVEYKDE